MGDEISLIPRKKNNVNIKQYEKEFRIKASRSGFSEEETTACLKYAEPLLEQKLPVIYNTANLAALVGYKTNYIKRAAIFTPYFYRSFQIKKKNGKLRTLVEPLPSLKEIQSWILENILYEIKVSKYAKAYIKNRTLIENVRYHKGREVVLALDIENFFGSIKLSHVEKIFLDFGYSDNISNLLAKLCTYDGCLPQGAPTSPYLSNIYLNDFDEKVSKYCNDNEIRYTRYADDLTFSGTKEDMINMVNYIKNLLSDLDLSLNNDKESLMGRNQRQVVTGIVVNDKLQIPRNERNQIRNEVHYLIKFGLEEHLSRMKINKANYIDHLLGKINFALHINPNDERMKKYKGLVQSLKQQGQSDNLIS